MGIFFLEGRENRNVWIEQTNFEREMLLGIFDFRKILWYRQGAQRVKNIGNEEYRTRTERQNRFQNFFRRILEVLWLQDVPQVKNFESRKIGKIIIF